MFLRQLRYAPMVAVGKAQEVILDFDGLDRPEGRIHPQLGDFQQSNDRRGDWAEAILEFLSHLADRLDVLHSAHAAIHVDFVPHVLDVLRGQIGLDRELDIDVQGEFQRRLGHLSDGLVEQLAIEFIAYRRDMSALLGSQKVAGPSDFQVSHGDTKACAQL